MANLRVNKITSTETFEKTGSVQFDGTGDYLEIDRGSDTTFALGTDDFTIEMWVYRISNGAIISTADNGAYDRGAFALEETGNFVISQASGTVFQTFTAAVDTSVVNTWVHYAFVRKDNVVSCYEDGKLRVRQPTTINITYSDTNDLAIGARRTGGSGALRSYSNFFEGNISNVRIIKGRALYTENFKPSMRELEVTSETVLLACQSKTDATHEKTGKTITVNGNAVASELTPGILTPVPKAGAGSAITGSVEFVGKGDANYLTIANNSDHNFDTGDFTIEMWFRTSTTLDTHTLISKYGSPGSFNGWYVTLNSSGTKVQVSLFDGSSTQQDTSGGPDVNDGSWHHFAISRSGSSLKLFVDGVEVASATNSYDITSTSDVRISGYTGNNRDWDGFISNLRIVKGTALYTDDFIPPTRELKKVPGTTLLCCQDENSVTTEATGKTITVNGTPTASNFTPQVGDDKSVILDGVTNMNTENYFYLPTGDTITRDSRRGRGVFGGGNPGTASNVMQYVQIQSQGNALDFGDLTVARQASGLGSATRGVFGGNAHPNGDTMDFITIASTGNAIDFGNLQSSLNGRASAASSTRGIFAGGGTPSVSNEIDFITIASTGDATNFGDLTAARRNHAGVASPIRAAFAGGDAGPTTDAIDFVTIASIGNAVDFGDLSAARETAGGASSSTRGVFMGGYTSPGDVDVIEYITIASKGDAKDFGNLSAATRNGGCVSNKIRGLYGGGHPTVNTIEFVTIASTGDASDFGDLLVGLRINPNQVSDSHGGLG